MKDPVDVRLPGLVCLLRLLRILPLCIGLAGAGCGAASMKDAPAEEEPRVPREGPARDSAPSRTSDPGARVAAARDRIDALRAELPGAADTPADASEDTGTDEAGETRTQEAPAPAADRKTTGDAGPSGCDRYCDPADGICDSARVICDVADEDPSYRGDCDWASDVCLQARADCDACQ